MLTTKQKMWLAALAQKLVVSPRRIFGKGDLLVVDRAGIRWELDLREGIDFSIYLLGVFEPGTAKTLSRLIKPGDVVFDIGANIGAHTLKMARAVGSSGKVFAIEPSDFAFAKLNRNFSLNPQLKPRVNTEQLFLAEKVSDSYPSQVYASWPLRGDVTVHSKHRGRLVSTSKASIITLDDFVRQRDIKRVDLIKIDVDGAELPILEGGHATLSRYHPKLVMELAPYAHAEQNHSFGDLVELLRSTGYALQNADGGKPVPLDLVQLQRLIPDGASMNVVCTSRSASSV